MKIGAIALLVAALAGGVANAQTSVGYGVNFSCGDWTSERKTDPNGIIIKGAISWVQGYLSGLNLAWSRGKPELLFAIPNPNSLSGWLDNSCRDKPLDKLQDASFSLAADLAFAQASRNLDRKPLLPQ